MAILIRISLLAVVLSVCLCGCGGGGTSAIIVPDPPPTNNDNPPATDPVDPGDDPGDTDIPPGTDPGDGGDVTDPGDDPVDVDPPPGTDPGDGGDVTDPGDDPGGSDPPPGTDPGDPVDDEDTTDPMVQDFTIDPVTISPYGGNVTISAVVTDNVAVSSAVALVTKPDLSVVTVPLSGTFVYSATYAAPSNPTGSNQTYTVRVRATDTSNNSFTADSLSFTVLAPGLPPPPPPPL